MFVPTELTYVEAIIGVVGLIIAGYMSKKHQAAKKYKNQLQREKDKLPPTGV